MKNIVNIGLLWEIGLSSDKSDIESWLYHLLAVCLDSFNLYSLDANQMPDIMFCYGETIATRT